MALTDRFWAKVAKGEFCWEWTGAIGTHGYGVLSIRRGNTRTAHRLSWEIAYGSIPSGMHVLHICDNRRCVRPDHLWLGTNADNVADMDAKGRRRNAHGAEVACRRGHVYTPETTNTSSGYRRCRPCDAERARKRHSAAIISSIH